MAEDNLEIRILRIELGEEIVHARKIQLRTTRGEIPLIMHSSATQPRAVLCVYGARGGFDGPELLYAPRSGPAEPGDPRRADELSTPRRIRRVPA